MQALYWERKGSNVICKLCPHHCTIQEGKLGLCGVRKNEHGVLQSLVYENVSAVSLDPIEKKPLHHFFPGSSVLSFGTVGCNLACAHCQNADIAQTFSSFGEQYTVQKLVTNDYPLIAATYNEPTIYYEFMLSAFKAARERKKKTIMVSNGFIEEKPLRALLGFLDAANIDLKGSDTFYCSTCRGRLDPVQQTISLLHQAGVWLELTYLLIPTKNDNKEDIRLLFSWIVETVGKDVPLHISAFYPMHKIKDVQRTSIRQLNMAYDIATSLGIHFVYVGNVVDDRTNTYCPQCKTLLIEREKFQVNVHAKGGVCPTCSTVLPGVWKD